MKRLLFIIPFLLTPAFGQLVNPTLKGAHLQTNTFVEGVFVATQAAMTGNVINVTLTDQVMTVDGDETLTLSGAPDQTYARFGFSLIGDGTARTITLPAGTWKKTDGSNATVTTFTLPANGKAILGVKYLGSSTYEIGGIPAIGGTDYAPPISQTGTLGTPSTTTPLSPSLLPGETRILHIGGTQTINLPAAAGCKDAMIYGNFMGSYVATLEPTGSEIIYIENVAQTAGINVTATGTITQTFAVMSDGTSWWIIKNATTATPAAGT